MQGELLDKNSNKEIQVHTSHVRYQTDLHPRFTPLGQIKAQATEVPTVEFSIGGFISGGTIAHANERVAADLDSECAEYLPDGLCLRRSVSETSHA